jgi:hypothetical protein
VRDLVKFGHLQRGNIAPLPERPRGELCNSSE